MTDYEYLTRIANYLQEIQKIDPFLGKLIEKDNSFFGLVILDELFGTTNSNSIIIDHQMPIPSESNVYLSYLEMILNDFANPSTKFPFRNNNYVKINKGVEYNA